MEQPAKYDVTVSPVREISVLGTADYDFWRDRLSSSGLGPSPTPAGKAQILVVTADTRFMGIAFQELSISVFVDWVPPGPASRAVFLVRAFNSRSCFAWFERTLFHTPYCHGVLEMTLPPAARLELRVAGQLVLQLAMTGQDSDSRSPIRSGEEGWEGPIFLPSPSRKKGPGNRLFFAKIRGETSVYAADPQDRLVIHALAGYPVFQDLLDSQFAIQEWIVRPRAVHSKSKTVSRRELE